jgi:cell division protease FtsH
VVAGLEKRNRLMNDQEKDIVAHHEAGHALVASLLPGTDTVHKVSMIPRGMAALGYTLQRPTEDRYLMRHSELINRMAVMLGGRSAEELVFDEVSTGAQNDLQRCTELAREMVVDFGMSEEIGPLSYSTDSKHQQGPEALWGRPYSERTARRIDEAIRGLVDSAHERARQLLTDKRDALLALAELLKEKEVVEQDELRNLLSEHGVEHEEQHLDETQEMDGEEMEPPEEDALRPESPAGEDEREGRAG